MLSGGRQERAKVQGKDIDNERGGKRYYTCVVAFSTSLFLSCHAHTCIFLEKQQVRPLSTTLVDIVWHIMADDMLSRILGERERKSRLSKLEGESALSTKRYKTLISESHIAVLRCKEKQIHLHTFCLLVFAPCSMCKIHLVSRKKTNCDKAGVSNRRVRISQKEAAIQVTTTTQKPVNAWLQSGLTHEAEIDFRATNKQPLLVPSKSLGGRATVDCPFY